MDKKKEREGSREIRYITVYYYIKQGFEHTSFFAVIVFFEIYST